MKNCLNIYSFTVKKKKQKTHSASMLSDDWNLEIGISLKENNQSHIRLY